MKVGRKMETHFVSNSIKLVSMGGSDSGTAETNTHTLAHHTVSTETARMFNTMMECRSLQRSLWTHRTVGGTPAAPEVWDALG